ncbi:MAG: ACT domain-containing protein [Nitrososphaera sp.]
MPRTKQLTVPCQNRPGELARIAKVLGDAKVNILSCLTTTSGGEGATHLVVDNVNKAKTALEGTGFSYTEADLLQVELPNTPGALAKFAGKLAEKGINITLGYQTAVKGSRKACLVLAVSDLDKASRVR